MDAPEALLEPVRIPGQVVVDHEMHTLEVDALACCIGRDEDDGVRVGLEASLRCTALLARHDSLRDQARHLRGKGLTGETLFAAISQVNAEYCIPPKTAEEVRQAIGDVEKFAPDPIPEKYRRKTAGKGPDDEPAEVLGIDGADLLALDLPPLREIVPGLLPEGTSVLAAPPKVGKSCLVYQIAAEVAVGGELFGQRVESDSALYLALEDGKRRGQQRLRAALGHRTLPSGRLEVQMVRPARTQPPR